MNIKIQKHRDLSKSLTAYSIRMINVTTRKGKRFLYKTNYRFFFYNKILKYKITESFGAILVYFGFQYNLKTSLFCITVFYPLFRNIYIQLILKSLGIETIGVENCFNKGQCYIRYFKTEMYYDLEEAEFQIVTQYINCIQLNAINFIYIFLTIGCIHQY